MKTLKSLALIGIAACSLSAQADTFSITGIATSPNSSAGSPLATVLTATGTQNFTFKFDGVSDVGEYFNYALSQSIPGTLTLGAPVSSFSKITAIVAGDLGVTQTISVPWTASGVTATADKLTLTFWISDTANDVIGNADASGTQKAYFTVAAVPEPSQTLAGIMLLGCGALVFTGRRWMKNQAAK